MCADLTDLRIGLTLDVILSRWFLQCAHTLVVNLRRVRSKDKYWQQKKKKKKNPDRRINFH